MPRCAHCSYYSDKTYNLERHEKTHVVSKKKKKSYDCLLCCESVRGRDELIHHFSSVHDVVISSKTLTFENEISFFSWKTQVQKDTASRFVRHGHIFKCKNRKTVHYYCHRDGFFSSQSTGKRRLKVLGSNKINSCCPARISATTDTSSGSVKVVFVETHVGHKHDLGRLHLCAEERNEIAAKIAAGIQFKDILKGIRKSVCNKEVEFIHLLTRKDLWNIQQQFNLNNEAVRHQSDYISVHSWVTENEGNQVVRFYKQQGVSMASHPELSAEDFVLVIANDSQLTMLEEFGNDVVCIDGTHGLNQYDFELTTILVLDELRQGFPCAIMLSNRTDAAVMQIFFSVIKDELDSPIAPKTFMSDMAEAYRNAWCAVISSPPNVLFCSWHVDKAWKKNLSKVKNDVKKAEVYKTLRTLFEETDEQAFTRLLESTLFDFQEDIEKQDFGKYFASEYSKSVRQWAYCYRTYVGVNANMHLESLHKTIKHCYFEGKKVKRLDKCINVLMHVIRDKLFDRLITSHRGKISKKVSDIRRRHDAALKMEKEKVQLFETEQGWSISSSSSPSTYYSIVPWKIECTCELRCDDCNICLHSYKCECLDSSIKWVICRHIHFMALARGSRAPQPYKPTEQHDCDDVVGSPLDDGTVGDLLIDEQPRQDKIQDVILKDISQDHCSSASFENFKNSLKEEMLAALDFARTTEDLQMMKNGILHFIPTMEAARCTSEVFVAKRKVDTRQKMSPQKHFFSTKSKKSKKERLLRKPSTEEKILHANMLLQKKKSQQTDP